MKVGIVQCKDILVPSKIPGMDYALNPYTGCSHGCSYCYASFMNRFTGHRETWGSYVDVKANAADRLQAQLRRPKQGTVLLSSVTDPYQPIEVEFGITRSCLLLLAKAHLKVSILTKSDLICRDIDVLKDLPSMEVGLTITTPSDALSRLLEEGAPPTSIRLGALSALAVAGLKPWVFVAPLGPYTHPAKAEALFQMIVDAGASSIMVDGFNFYPAAIRRVTKRLQGDPRRSLFARALANRDAYWQELEDLVASQRLPIAISLC